MSKVTFIYILVICAFAKGQRFQPGYCRSLPVVENFDKNRVGLLYLKYLTKMQFFGHWIEAEKTPSMFDMMMRCMEVDFTEDKDGSINVALKGATLAGLPISINGDGLVQDVTKHGSYSVRYGFGVPFQGTLTTVLDTNYDEYALVYSCTNSLLSGIFHTGYVWILSRDGKLSNPTRQNIYELLDKHNINRNGLQISDRANCPSNETVHRESNDLLLTTTLIP